MTLLLSANFANQAALQVTDRRLSQAARTFDYANKQLLIRCEDAMVLVAYTGIARLSGEPTDDWIARHLLQTDAKLTHNFGGPTLPVLSFNEIYRRLREAMLLTRNRRQTTPEGAGLTVSMVGLRRVGTSRAVEPFWSTFQQALGQLNIWVSPKHEYARKQIIKIDSFGSGAGVAKRYIDMTLPDRGLTDRTDFEDYLVEVVRHVAGVTASVGPDAAVASVNTDASVPFDASVRYVPGEGVLRDVYLPWILAPGFTAPPSVTISSGTLLGPACFRVRIPASGSATGSTTVLSVAPGPRPGQRLPAPGQSFAVTAEEIVRKGRSDPLRRPASDTGGT